MSTVERKSLPKMTTVSPQSNQQEEYMPTKLQPDEELALTVKQHWIVLTKTLVVPLLVVLCL
jgi:hypothetical protein